MISLPCMVEIEMIGMTQRTMIEYVLGNNEIHLNKSLTRESKYGTIEVLDFWKDEE